MPPANHKNNLQVCQRLINMASEETELARKAEVGTCTFRHHVDMGMLTGLVAIATSITTLGAMIEEQAATMKAIELIVLHPKKPKRRSDGPDQQT